MVNIMAFFRLFLCFCLCGRFLLRPFVFFRVRFRPFAPPVCHLVLSPLRFRWADHCLNWQLRFWTRKVTGELWKDIIFDNEIDMVGWKVSCARFEAICCEKLRFMCVVLQILTCAS